MVNELINLFIDEYSIEQEDERWMKENIRSVELILDSLENIDWNAKDIKELIMNVGKENEIKGKVLMMPIRLALTGKTAGPDISKTMEIFGKEKTIQRLKEATNN